MKNNIVAGVDEVGRGCLAGPVISAAVILKKTINLDLLKDSKKINFINRVKIANHIRKNSYFAIGASSVKEIFNYNILNASLLSMKRAIFKLPKKPKIILIDGLFAPKGIRNFKTIINGDQKFKCISAASIIAKEYRDLLMIKLSHKFKHYAWEKNFGYGTRDHLLGLKKYGITPYHRKSFKPVYKILSKKN